jgi:hypothetical protein
MRALSIEVMPAGGDPLPGSSQQRRIEPCRGVDFLYRHDDPEDLHVLHVTGLPERDFVDNTFRGNALRAQPWCPSHSDLTRLPWRVLGEVVDVQRLQRFA